MPFGPGNQAAVGYGRPRRIDREVARLAEAAEHARALAEQGQLAALMTDSADLRELLERRVVAGLDALAEVEAQLAAMRALAEPVEDVAEKDTGQKRRRRGADPDPLPKIHEDPWAMSIATAAAALDRLVGEEVAQ